MNSIHVSNNKIDIKLNERMVFELEKFQVGIFVKKMKVNFLHEIPILGEFN